MTVTQVVINQAQLIAAPLTFPAQRLGKLPVVRVPNALAGDALTLSAIRRGPLPPQPLKFEAYTPETSLTHLPLGQVGEHSKLRLGTYTATCFSLTAAQAEIARAQKKWGNDEDYAIIQTPQGHYAVFELEMPALIFSDFNDISLYSSMRQSQIEARLPAGYALTALVTDQGQMRFYQGQASPLRLAKIPNPQPQDSLETLDSKAVQVLERLKMMEQALGSQRDHRGIFAAMYRVITTRAYAEFQKFRAAGDLQAAAFEGRLLINFANKYFAAYDALAEGRLDDLPEPWRSVFDLGRHSQMQGYPRLSITEIVGLSMVAHIIHDLPFSLQEIGFDASDPHLSAVYDKFNQTLMAEKSAIIDAIAYRYGQTDLEKLEACFVKTVKHLAPHQGQSHAEAVELGLFSAMRNVAKHQAQQANPEQIRRVADGISDALRVALPGV